ncbi:fimbrial protein, partial [Proteus faecis]
MKNIINKLFLINVLIISPTSWASDSVNLNFTGNIRVATCNISSGDNINVNLKDIPAANFEKANSASSWNIFY